MIGYATIGVNDMEKAKSFYCDLFAEQGAKVVIDAGRIAMIGTGPGTPMVAVCEPYNKEAPQPGNGTMLAFPTETKETAAAPSSSDAIRRSKRSSVGFETRV